MIAFAAENDDGPDTETLYQNRSGAFFVVAETTGRIWNELRREHSKRLESASSR
jgi:hypothetical protein